MAKTGRNEPCPCGSGKKYKHCCLTKDQAVPSEPPSVAAQSTLTRTELLALPQEKLADVTFQLQQAAWSLANRLDQDPRNSAHLPSAQAADHLVHHHPRFCENCNAQIGAAARSVPALIKDGKLDDAEQAAQAMIERWPDLYEGYDCFGMVCEARGDKGQAAEYYRKVIAIAREEPQFYDDDFPEYYENLIRRLDRSSMGALPPDPRDI